MNTSKRCPDCGAVLAADAPQGLCPRCLFARAGLGATTTQPPLAEPESIATIVQGTSDPVAAPRAATKVQYFGDYELLEEIARGGMGVVYKARQASLNRVVAVKMILAGQLAGEMEVRRFRTEAEAAANLQHPNIVAIHEIGEHEGSQYFSMDYVAGRNLAQAVREGPMEPMRAARLVQVIAEAIQYAHQRGILHRDLKPHNVLLDEREQPRITDFGLAKLMKADSGMTHTGTIMGSPSYMPPEQASGRADQVGPASDVYAMGAILFHLLTGRPPFAGETPMATLTQVLGDEPPSPAALNPLVPADLATICLKCLEKKPERRYATARALAEDLGRFLNAEPVLARPASPWRKAWTWAKRRPWLLMLVLTAIVVALLGTVFWLQTENGFLRWIASHPDYVRKAGPFTQRLPTIVQQMMGTGGIGHGLFASLLIARFLVRKRRLKAAGTARTAKEDATMTWDDTMVYGALPIIYGVLPIVLGVILLRLGIVAHLWEGASLRMPLTFAVVLVYCGAFVIVESLPILLRTPRAMARLAERRALQNELKAASADLRRGDWGAFLAKALPSLYAIDKDPHGQPVDTGCPITLLRLAIVVATLAAVLWIRGMWDGAYEGLAVGGWMCGAFYALLGHSLRKAWRNGRLSAKQALAFLVLCIMASPLALFVAVSGDLVNEAASLLKPAVSGLALGLIAGVALIRNSKPQNPENAPPSQAVK